MKPGGEKHEVLTAKLRAEAAATTEQRRTTATARRLLWSCRPKPGGEAAAEAAADEVEQRELCRGGARKRVTQPPMGEDAAESTSPEGVPETGLHSPPWWSRPWGPRRREADEAAGEAAAEAAW